MRPGLRTLAASVVALALALPATALGSSAVVANPVQKTTLPDVEDEVMCPVCGTALSLAGGPQADREREFIRRQIAAGKTKDEIKDALVAEYGTEVLAEPPKSGFSLTAWLVPIAAILVAAIAIVLGLRRWRRAGRGGDGPDDPGRPLDPSERERLDRDLARYDL